MTDTREPTPRIPPELIAHLRRGDCVLFVGDALDAGPSPSARLASALVDACDAHAECVIPACQSGGGCARPQGCAVPMARAAQLYEACHNRQALVDFVIGHADNAGEPGLIHRALASLPARIIVTTAYDDRLERALKDAGRSFLSVVRDEQVPYDDPNRVQLIRLHGTLSQPDSLVLTEDDAADLFGRLPAVTRILQAHFASKTLLFAGYGLSDPHFLSLYRQAIGPIERHQRLAYAVQWPPNPLAVNRWRGKISLVEVETMPALAEIARQLAPPPVVVAPQPAIARVEAKLREPPPLPPEPYKFLDYYTRQDAAIFFGRDAEADLLLSMILARRLTIFYGRSGTGKTSLLLARVAPSLEEAGYRIAYARMLGDPSTEVKAAARGVPSNQLSLSDQRRSLREVLAGVLAGAPAANGRLVIVLDQFEEFFIRQGESVRQAFACELVECLSPFPLPGGRAGDEGGWSGNQPDLHFVLSLRDDYLGALDELSDILPGDVFAHRFRLKNLSHDKALQAMLKPAEAFGLPVEAGLGEQLLDDLEDEGMEPANLQIVLYRLYRDAVEQGLWSEKERRGAGLTLARYSVLGGTKAILAGYLDEVIGELPAEEQRQGAQVILKSMVTSEATKAAVSGREIARGDLVSRLGLTAEQVNALLAYLRDRRVVRKFGDEDRYELAHEVMVSKVWAWVSDEELRLLDVRDMLRREMSNYRKFGHLLAPEKLDLVNARRAALALDEAEAELVVRSTLDASAGQGSERSEDVAYWRGRAPAVVGKVEGELLDALGAQDTKRAQQAVAGLAELASPSLVARLAALVEQDFTVAPVVWVDHEGERQKVLRTALNLVTSRQCNALTALARMVLPEATEALQRWTPPGMVLVPAGPFTMGSNEHSDENPEHLVRLDAFWIDHHPVTNAQWEAFLASKPWQRRELWTEAGWQWKEGEDPEPLEWSKHRKKRDHPVRGICWYEALAYAWWSGKCLLSEAYWERAARGTDGRRYPWGEEFDADKCNTSESRTNDTTPVGQYSPTGDSPYGVADMAGNIWEWCSSLRALYPYNAVDGREVLEGSRSRVVRGGGFANFQDGVRVSFRYFVVPLDRSDHVGVRVGVAVPFSPTSGI